MAYRVGAELVDMEMVTFCPNVILYPPMYRGSIFTYVVHARLLNNKGEAFMDRYDAGIKEIAEKTEWNKLIHSIASMREIVDGLGSEHGGVYWSLRHLSRSEVEDIGQSNPFVLGWKFQGIDYSELMKHVMEGYDIEVAPAAHYFEGGIKIDENCATSIEGLYAAGECTGGLFGANRVSAATTEMLVEGAVAGAKAAEYASKIGEVKIDLDQVKELVEKTLSPLKKRKGLKVMDLRRHVQEVAYKNIGVLRDGEHLKGAIQELKRIREEDLPRVCVGLKGFRYNLEWIEALQLENMIQVLEISARSALLRRESRGVHYRVDYPKTDNDHWLRNIVIKRVNGELKLTTRPVVVSRVDPPRGVIAFEDMIKNAVKILRS
jgi:succinate dehydrogenase/fumarate reductase flavoprotein subunit